MAAASARGHHPYQMTARRLTLAGLVAAVALALAGGAGAAGSAPPPAPELRALLVAGGLTYTGSSRGPNGQPFYLATRMESRSSAIARMALGFETQRQAAFYAAQLRSAAPATRAFETGISAAMGGWRRVALTRVRTWHAFIVIDLRLRK
jgi:hypothetical protein